MKVYTDKIIPEKIHRVCTNRECDLCGTPAKSGPDWNRSWRDIAETKVCVSVKSEVGSGDSDGGHKDVYDIDICPKCFEDRLVPWVNSLRVGKPPIESEYQDW